MTITVTRVRICVYKPTGWEEVFAVMTEDRGAAIERVMDDYTKGEMKYVNFIGADLTSLELFRKQHPKAKVLNAPLTIRSRVPKVKGGLVDLSEVKEP